jgi:polyadenylate-binding protein
VAPEKKLYVGRAQKKSEREKELREHYDKLKQERMKKFAGVNLYVKNLADSTTEEKLKEEFGAHGTITSAKVMVDSAGKSKGFGFVCYSNPEEAAKATQEMNGKMVDGKPLYVAAAQRKDQRRQQLQFQYSGGRKMGPGTGQQFQYGPGMPQPMYFPAGMPQRNVYYPGQQMQMRQWPQQGQQGPQQVNYQLMAVQPRQGGRGGRGGRQRKDSNVRNQRQHQRQQQPEPAQPQPQAASEPGALTTSELAAAPEEQRKQMIGERLFPLVKGLKPEMAGKITGMLLEMDNGELLHLLESREALSEKVGEADMVLQEFANAQQAAAQ